jgi:hypothetical protein
MLPIRRSIGGLVRSSKPAIRSFSAAAGADAPKRRILPWLIGAVGLGAGSWYFWKGNSAAEDNPVKTASEIIKVPVDAFWLDCINSTCRHSKNQLSKNFYRIRLKIPIILDPTLWSSIWISFWFAIFGMY